MADNKKELMMYRMSGAKEKLDSSKLLLDYGNYKDSIGRSYYAMFSAVRAILALDGFVKVVEAYLESERLGQ